MNAIRYEDELKIIDALFDELELRQRKMALIINLDELVKQGEKNGKVK